MIENIKKLLKHFKSNPCALVQITYHMIFISGTVYGGNQYLYEIRKAEQKVVKEAKKIQNNIDKLNKIGNNINSNLKKVEKLCRF